MAREFDDLGFWLPSEFLTDDDVLTDFKSDRIKSRRFDDFSFGLQNSFGFNSDLSLPGDTVTSPTETETEDDVVVSELTRKLAQSTLRNSNFSSHHTSKGSKLSGSPQSTLCGCKFSSSGSPNSVSGVCSPPDAKDFLRRDYLYAAAEEVARMRMIEETMSFYSSKLLPPQVKPSPSPAAGFYMNHGRSQNHISSQLLQAAKQQQLMLKKGVYGPRVRESQVRNGMRNCNDGRALGLSMPAWPGLQQPSSGTRAVFLGESEPKKERTGTGVFLPNRLGSVPAVSRKKAGCATVLLPEKVVQALNLDVESNDANLQHSVDYGASIFDYDAAATLKHKNNVMMVAQQRRNLAAQAAMSQQLRLPQDWTY